MTWLVVAWGNPGEETRRRRAQAPRSAQADAPTETRGVSPQSRGASATMYPGRLWRQRDASASRGMWETACTTSRPWVAPTAAQAARDAVRRFEGDGLVGVPDSFRRVWGPEGPDFGRDSNGVRMASASSCSQQVRWVKAQSRSEAQGSNGRTSRGNAAGEQRTLGGETPEVGATFGERIDFG